MTINEPVFMWVRVGDLMVDHDVQRALQTPHVSRLQRDGYDRAALGTITVSFRATGERHVIDGQSRCELVLREEGSDAMVPCLVFVGLTLEEEAMLFRKNNTFRGVHQLDKYRIRMKEREPVAVELSAMLAEHGWTVGSGRDGRFAAIVELERIRNGGDARLHRETPDAARRTIAIITDAWGHNRDGARSEIVGAIGRVIIRHPEVDDKKIARELAIGGGPLALVSAARARTTNRRQRLYNVIAAMVVEAHNKGRRSNRLPAWEPK